MPGEFYEEAKQQKLDLSDIKDLISQIQPSVSQVTDGVTQVIDTVIQIQSKVNTLETRSEGIPPVSGSIMCAWQTAESDVVTIASHSVRYKVHSLLLSIQNLVGSIITVRMYMALNGSQRKVYEQSFNAASDPPGLWLINGTVGIHEALRVTVQSNNAADNGKAVDYDYMLEAMQ